MTVGEFVRPSVVKDWVFWFGVFCAEVVFFVLLYQCSRPQRNKLFQWFWEWIRMRPPVPRLEVPQVHCGVEYEVGWRTHLSKSLKSTSALRGVGGAVSIIRPFYLVFFPCFTVGRIEDHDQLHATFNMLSDGRRLYPFPCGFRIRLWWDLFHGDY